MYSMTGYGGADQMYDHHRINVNIRSLNSKFADVRIKIPSELADMEIQLRQSVLETLIRGKVDIQITIEGMNEEDHLCEIDENIFARYYQQLESLRKSFDLDQQNVISALINLPGVLRIKEVTADEGLKKAIFEVFQTALRELNEHRRSEGEALKKALDQSVRKITENHAGVKMLERERMALIRERLQHLLQQEIEPEKIDNGRFEQELIYYLDKLDIHEEMVRLDQHCAFFLEEMNSAEMSMGKKLNFIAQEIGREINTIGAKASHAGIQQLVVEMKNELDKIREQLANIL